MYDNHNLNYILVPNTLCITFDLAFLLMNQIVIVFQLAKGKSPDLRVQSESISDTTYALNKFYHLIIASPHRIGSLNFFDKRQ